MPGKDIKINLLLDGKEFTATVRNSDALIGQLKGKVNSVTDSMSKWAMITTGFNQGMMIANRLAGYVSNLVSKYGEQEQAEKKLTVALGRKSQALLDDAAALQKQTTYGDEQIIQAQALIASFTKDETQIKSLTRATLDLASAKGMDLTAAADLVAKSIGSSTNALSRYGITIKGAVGSTERAESAVQAITDLFGGQATGAAQTYTGQLEQLKNKIGDVEEKLGRDLVEASNDATSSIGGLLDGFTALDEQMRTTTGTGVLGNVISFFEHISTFGFDPAQISGANAQLKIYQKNWAEANKTMAANQDLWKGFVQPSVSEQKSMLLVESQVNTVGEIKQKIEELKKANDDNNISVEQYKANLIEIRKLQEQITPKQETKKKNEYAENIFGLASQNWKMESQVWQEKVDKTKEWNDQLMEMGIENWRNENELWQRKQEIFDEENNLNQEKIANEQVRTLTSIELKQQLTDAEERRKNIYDQIRQADSVSDLKRLNEEKKNIDKRIEAYRNEQKAREQVAQQAIMSYMSQYDANLSFGQNIVKISENIITSYIREAIASALAGLVTSFGPFGLIAAAVAAGAIVSGVKSIFEGFLPGYAQGGINVRGGFALVGEKGPEIVNLPQGSDVITATESRKIIMGYGFNNSNEMDRLIAVIENQTQRLERIERIAMIDPDQFHGGYQKYLKQIENI